MILAQSQRSWFRAAREALITVALMAWCPLLHAGSSGDADGSGDGSDDGGSAHGMTACHDHVDIDLYWDGGQWVADLKTDAGRFAVDDLFLYLSDKPHVANNPANSGARRTQPTNPDYDFTGVPDGESLWIADQGTPGIGDVFPGFNSEQGDAYLANHQPADSRISVARPWIRISLVDYLPPYGRSSHFSMWNTTSGRPPTVWMSTMTETPDDSYYFSGGTHAHLFWGFGAQGIHQVRLRASSVQSDGTPTGYSEPFTVTFAVGTVAYWQASWFDAVELEDPERSSLSADPDDDGFNNLMEYAFGTNPRRPGAVPLADGLGLPSMTLETIDGQLWQTLTYPRRRAGARLVPEIYRPLFGDSPNGPWSDTAVTTQVYEFPASQAELNIDWELVVSRRPAPAGRESGFGRVAVRAGDGF